MYKTDVLPDRVGLGATVFVNRLVFDSISEPFPTFIACNYSWEEEGCFFFCGEAAAVFFAEEFVSVFGYFVVDEIS
ncbi:MAG: hypothetical protein Kapaf2KO_10390 [Candidatus Kapaibacteriales bacterium]